MLNVGCYLTVRFQDILMSLSLSNEFYKMLFLQKNLLRWVENIETLKNLFLQLDK
jgi:hypothetical protein